MSCQIRASFRSSCIFHSCLVSMVRITRLGDQIPCLGSTVAEREQTESHRIAHSLLGFWRGCPAVTTCKALLKRGCILYRLRILLSHRCLASKLNVRDTDQLWVFKHIHPVSHERNTSFSKSGGWTCPGELAVSPLSFCVYTPNAILSFSRWLKLSFHLGEKRTTRPCAVKIQESAALLQETFCVLPTIRAIGPFT